MVGISDQTDLTVVASSSGEIADLESIPSFERYPFRSRPVAQLGRVIADQAGRFALVSDDWAALSADSNCDADTTEYLRRWGFGASPDDRLERLSHHARALARQAPAGALDYLILVPTLRCDLACSYCQVSRVQQNATGFDWSEETLLGVEQLLDSLQTDHIKIEFQGGEPTLRLDIVERIIARCERFANRSFVICTNLSKLTPQLMALLDRGDVSVSTSLDGESHRHERQRTASSGVTDQFFENLKTLVEEYGPDKVSALPTIDQENPPEPGDLIAAYTQFGFTSIYLRPINFQGFARKRHQAANEAHAQWWDYHERFVRRLIALNFADRSRVREESYFSLCLRRIFRIGLDRHVDLRNPNWMGLDYLVIDYDGSFYPTDEARMLSRSGIVDLAIGSIGTGIDHITRDLLNANATINGDPDCDRCPYQAYCGRDVIDDLSRYGRIDKPRHETFFCQKQLAMFDLAMTLIYSEDAATQYSLAKWLGLSGDRLPGLPRL